MKHTLFG